MEVLVPVTDLKLILTCLLCMIANPCKDIGHYYFYVEGNLTLLWEQMKIVLSFGIPEVSLRTAGNDGYFKKEILGSFSKKNLRLLHSKRNLQTFDV